MPRKVNAATRNRQMVIDLARQGVSQTQIAKRIGTNSRYVRALLLQEGVPLPQQRLDMHHNPNWKGGEMVDKQGYILVRMPGHHLSDSHGYVRKHRLIAEQKLGRRLHKKEVVHHLDDDPTNNDPDNLEIYATNGAHLADTLQGCVPNWTPEGRQRTLEGVRRPRKKRAASHDASKPHDDQMR